MKEKPLWRKKITLKDGTEVEGISEEQGFNIINTVFFIASNDGWDKEAEGEIYTEILRDVKSGRLFPLSIPCCDVLCVESQMIKMLRGGIYG